MSTATYSSPMPWGRQTLIAYVDRTAFEVVAANGLVYVPMPVIPSPKNTTVRVSTRGGGVTFRALDLHVLRSAWLR